MNRVVLGLGSNIDKERHLPEAVRWLRQMCQVTAVASVYESVPVGLVTQPHFWNTAVCLLSPHSPTTIKQTLIAELETVLGRVRQADVNAPRTIDADIVLFNQFVGQYDGGDGRWRRLPDPDLLEFPHVAVPVAELLPDELHPETGERLTAVAARLMAQAGERPLWKRPDIVL